MDSLFGRLTRRLGAFVLLVVGMGVFAPSALADTYEEAMAKCLSWKSVMEGVYQGPGHAPATATCEVGTTAGSGYAVFGYLSNYSNNYSHKLSQTYPFVGTPPPPDPCLDQADMSGAFSGNLGLGASMCARKSDGTGCAMTFTPDSPPFLNRAGTQWATHGTYKKTGGACTPSGENAPPPPAPPKSCGGLSCYDSGGDKYCMVNSSGAQVCVKGADGRKPGGACASGGDATLCAGAPQPPKPPAPPQSPISDPPTEGKGGDSFTNGSNGAGGTTPGAGNITITTGVYGAGGSPTGSGQVGGDDGPPGASTSGLPGGTGNGDGDKGDDTGASGGGDCNNAPSVSGSPALAMVAMQAWQTRCAAEKVHQDLSGDGKTSPGDITTPSGKSAWVDTPASGDASADAANKGNYDTSGMGFSTVCPLHDLQVPLWDGRSFAIAFSKGCDVGAWIRALVIAFALFAAAKITVGGNN